MAYKAVASHIRSYTGFWDGPSPSIDQVYLGTDLEGSDQSGSRLERLHAELALTSEEAEGPSFSRPPENLSCILLIEDLTKKRQSLNNTDLELLKREAKATIRASEVGGVACRCPIFKNLGFCPLAKGGIPSLNGKRFSPIYTYSASRLIGATKSRKKVDRAGAIAISNELDVILHPEESEALVVIEGRGHRESDLTTLHYQEWLEEYGPAEVSV